jgi:hypothetical protein
LKQEEISRGNAPNPSRVEDTEVIQNNSHKLTNISSKVKDKNLRFIDSEPRTKKKMSNNVILTTPIKKCMGASSFLNSEIKYPQPQALTSHKKAETDLFKHYKDNFKKFRRSKSKSQSTPPKMMRSFLDFENLIKEKKINATENLFFNDGDNDSSVIFTNSVISPRMNLANFSDQFKNLRKPLRLISFKINTPLNNRNNFEFERKFQDSKCSLKIFEKSSNINVNKTYKNKNITEINKNNNISSNSKFLETTSKFFFVHSQCDKETIYGLRILIKLIKRRIIFYKLIFIHRGKIIPINYFI